METTVNKECDNYMKQMFNTCENGYRDFIILFSWRFVDLTESYQKVYM